MTLSTRKVVMRVSPGATQEDDCAIILNETSPPVGSKNRGAYPDLLQGGWNRAFNDFMSGQSFRGETSYVRVHHAGQGGGAWHNDVFADDGGNYAMIGEGGGAYCVDLRISVPSGTPSGSYQDEIALQDLVPMYLTRPTPAPSSTPTPIPTPTPSPTPTPIPTPDASIYAFNVFNSPSASIVYYPQGGYMPPPALTLAGLPGASWNINGALAFDSAGNLWVAYNAAPATSSASATNAVAEFVPGAIAPSHSILGSATGFANVAGIAIDASGDIFVADCATNTIDVFAPNATGNVAPIRTIGGSNTQLGCPRKLLFDARGNLWVNNGAGGLLEYASGSFGNIAPLRQLFTPTWEKNSGFISNQFYSFAIDTNGNIYLLVNQNSGVIVEYPPTATDSTAYIRRIDVGGSSVVNSFYDIGVDDHGYIYGVDRSPPYGVAIYSPSATGTAIPYAVISGSNAGFDEPGSIGLWISRQYYFLN